MAYRTAKLSAGQVTTEQRCDRHIKGSDRPIIDMSASFLMRENTFDIIHLVLMRVSVTGHSSRIFSVNSEGRKAH